MNERSSRRLGEGRGVEDSPRANFFSKVSQKAIFRDPAFDMRRKIKVYFKIG